jgi:hypothetical protein
MPSIIRARKDIIDERPIPVQQGPVRIKKNLIDNVDPSFSISVCL